ncbi:MAG: MmcQ/YjbR family DNA-binding protein [Planctomycetes bacterium]|nr:MmcQ/YjbR family DNA-binding protein [Planctomycetota bacterium]
MGTTVEQFRAMALAVPGAVEGAHHGHADFRCEGRVFASLHPDGEQAMVKVPPGVQQRLVRQLDGACSPASGAWGLAGCTMVRLPAVDRDVLHDALGEAWQFAAAGAAQRRRKK